MTDETPDVRVVKGEPTDDELAALITAVNLVATRTPKRPEAAPSNWSAYWRSVRTPLHPAGVRKPTAMGSSGYHSEWR